jgi:uncharacterized protein with NRDE domain
MCTLIILYKLLKDYPVIALHNRYLGKDTVEQPPRRIGDVVCPIDVASGGTWIGFNGRGLLLAITNQETQTLEKPGRSRGLLALDILRDCSTAEEAKDLLLAPSTRAPYRTGNFVVADAETGHHVVWDVETHHLEVGPGSTQWAQLQWSRASSGAREAAACTRARRDARPGPTSFWTPTNLGASKKPSRL